LAVDATNLLFYRQALGRRQGQTPRIVSAVLEPPERRHDRFANISALANVPENAAHLVPSLAGKPAR